MTKWEKMARQDMSPEALYRFFERSGKYRECMSDEDADKRAFLEEVRRAE